jgi:hypothetical protein
VLVGEPVEQLEEVVRNRLLDEEPCAGEADLACVVVLPRRLARTAVSGEPVNEIRRTPR